MNEPRKIGRYIVKSLLGEGAMGSVFRATDPNIGRTVAIKIVKFDKNQKDDEDTNGFRGRFQQEARISGNLNHPNIVAVYDVDQYEGMPFIAMEFVEGHTLAQYIHGPDKPGPLDLVRLLCQLAGALDFAHTHGVVHRDLKPANIMVTADGVPKIMDFGIAKQTGSNLTMTGVFLGTPSYSSPEQVKEGHVDHRSDIFSLGILACETLTGKLPFQGKSINAILYKIANEAPEFSDDLARVKIPLSRFREIFTKVLHKDPEKRYQSATAFTGELLAAMEFTASDRDKLDQTVNLMKATVAMDVGSKKLNRSEFEAAAEYSAKTVVSLPRKRSKASVWLIALFVSSLLIGGVAYYGHSSGKLDGWISSAHSLIAAEPVLTEPEPEPEPEKAPEPVKMITHQITIASQPPGGMVSLSGADLGQTPYTHNWEGRPGDQMALTLTLESYQPVTLDLTLSEEMVTVLNQQLVALPVGRVISAIPADAAIFLDGKQLGESPQELSLIIGQAYQFNFSHPDYLSKSFSYTEGSSSPEKLRVSMQRKPPPGTLVVSSLLEDLKLSVNGKAQGQLSLKLEAGTYSVRLTSAKYFYDETRDVTVTSKETTTMETPIVIAIPKIEFIGGYVNVKVDGQFVRRGKDLDTTPLVGVSVTAGSHRFEFIDSDGKIVHRKTIEVTRSEDIVVSADR